MTDDKRFAQWQAWIETISDDVQNILLRRQIFREIREIVEANPNIHLRSAFYDWMASAYAATEVIGVRRQVDDDRRAISLGRLLGDIRQNPHVLSRERHAALYQNMGRELGERAFDRLVGAGAPHVGVRFVQSDISAFRKATSGLERFATKRVAHFDQEAPRVPTYQELDGALDLLESLVKKYRLLLLAVGGEIVPMIVYDWKAIFREPWIPP